MTYIDSLFYSDRLSLLLMGLIGFVSLSVGAFAFRYLQGDRKQAAFYRNLVAMVLATFLLVNADHIAVLLLAWAASNYFLCRLMLHKSEWNAAKQSALLAGKNLALSWLFIALALFTLYQASGSTSIQTIINSPIDPLWAMVSGLFLVLGAMAQSALWPFHRWLASSLNSPTPVSALMHAGLINGGGFLLARFAPLLLEQSALLNLIFVLGIVSAILGTLWKLMQNDIKRMLAHSTMGQMGFMIAQCGMGLFPAAILHLIGHGLFKAYLFLASGSAAQEQRLDLAYPPSYKHFALALCCGLLGAALFAISSGKASGELNTNLFLIALASVAGTQAAPTIIRHQVRFSVLLAAASTLTLGGIYGWAIATVEGLLAPLGIAAPQALNLLHALALVALIGLWLGLTFKWHERKIYPLWALKLYVKIVNASQPHPSTVTTHRNHYQF